MSILISDLVSFGIPSLCYSDDGDGNAVTTNQCGLLIAEGGASMTPVVSVDVIEFLEEFYDIFATVDDVEHLQDEIDELQNNLIHVAHYLNNLKSYNIDDSHISISC